MACIAVIGAGPAGCSAAITLASKGHDVHLFERGSPGKDKPCGDAFLPDAINELGDLGIPNDLLPKFGGKPFTRFDLRDDRQILWNIQLNPHEGWVVRREAIDQALRDVAAQTVKIRYQTTVRQINWEEGLWRLNVDGPTPPYDAVVLATGATDPLSKVFGLSGKPLIGASVSAYGKSDEFEAPMFQFASHGGVGYGWVFPLSDGLVNVGICAIESGQKRIRSELRDYMRRWSIDPCSQIRGGVGPYWSSQGKTWHDNRGMISCGDAAGLVDPLTGEGITAALQSGKAAGEAVSDWLLDGRSPSTLNIYSKWVLTTLRVRYGATSARRSWNYLCQARQSNSNPRTILYN